MPFNVEILPNGTTATVNWMGDSQNYNVRYRKAAETVSPFFEGFNDLSGLPSGWTTFAIDDDHTGQWFTSRPYPQQYTDEDGNPRIYGEAYVRSDVGNGPVDGWLVTPQLDLQGTMSVLLRPFYAGGGNHFAIYLSTTGTNVSDFTTVLVPETAVGNKFTEYTADLSPYVGKKGYIAIRHFNSNDSWGILILENFSILIPDIPAGPWTTINTTEKTCELTGLEMGTRYEVQIQGITGSDQSEWCNINTFTAHIPLPAFDVMAMSQSAYIFPRNNTDTYEISYKPSSASEWTSVVASGKKYRITGLTASTSYDIRLRNIIGENSSDWNAQTFTTAAAGSAYGDVNRDDKISLADITAIINIMTGKPGNYNVEGADYNGDDVVDLFDLKNWLRILFYY